MKLSKIRLLNGNAIKLFACLCMLLDHIGVLWEIDAIRFIGRLAMPLFAFFVAEGCKHTKDKTKHFALIFSLGVLCQIVYSFVEPKSFVNFLCVNTNNLRNATSQKNSLHKFITCKKITRNHTVYWADYCHSLVKLNQNHKQQTFSL